jgi:hypothetical protein
MGAGWGWQPLARRGRLALSYGIYALKNRMDTE